MKFCKDCKHWWPVMGEGRHAYVLEDGFSNGGHCRSEKIRKGPPFADDALVYSYEESGRFWTGPSFGCVQWEDR